MANGNFQQRLEGLLGGQSTIGNLGLGLLANSGPRLQGTSNFGTRLGDAAQFAQDRRTAALQNERQRQQLRANRQRQNAMQELQGLLGESAVAQGGPGTEIMGVEGEPIAQVPGRQALVPRTSTPEGQQEMLGLLGQIAPQQTAAGLLQQMQPQQGRAEPASVRVARVLADPNESQEVKDELRAQLDESENREQISDRIKLLQMRQLESDLQQAEEESERERVEGRISVLNAQDALKEAAQINNRLRGTLGETGLGFDQAREALGGPWSAFVSMVGGNSDEARQVASDIQRFEQLTTREGLQSLFSGQMSAGTISNAKMNTYLTTKPGLSRLPETNNKILADMLQDNLDSAQTLGIEVPDRAATEQLIEQLRSTDQPESQPEPQPFPSGQVIDFNDLPE